MGHPDWPDLVTLVQEGIDATRLSLDPLLGLPSPSHKCTRAIALVQTKIDEAELWLGRAIEEAALVVPDPGL